MIPIRGVPTTLLAHDMIPMNVGIWGTKSRTWSMKGHWSSHKMARLSFSTIPPRLTIWSNKPWGWKDFCSLGFLSCNFLLFKHLLMLNVVISLIHRICLFWSNIFVFTICKLFSYFFWWSTLNNSKPLEGGWRKRYHNPQYAFEQTPLMRYRHCFNP